MEACNEKTIINDDVVSMVTASLKATHIISSTTIISVHTYNYAAYTIMRLDDVLYNFAFSHISYKMNKNKI